jgi:hypothetical protein
MHGETGWCDVASKRRKDENVYIFILLHWLHKRGLTIDTEEKRKREMQRKKKEILISKQKCMYSDGGSKKYPTRTRTRTRTSQASEQDPPSRK